MAKTVAKPAAAKPPAERKRRRSAFVPRVLGPAAVVAVIPVCVVAGCGSSTGFSVAAVAYPAYEAGVGGSPSTSAANATSSASSSSGIFVAAVAYPAYEGGTG